MSSLELASDHAEPLAEWLEPSLNDTAGRDPLGLNTITLDRILPRLVPGILQLSQRARYFSIYPWMLWQFAERRRPATSEELDRFIRRREFELCLAMKLCRHCKVAEAIGSLSAGPRVTANEDPFSRGVSVQSAKGGFGLYYRSPLAEMGAVASAGTALGPDERPTPIEVLAQDDRARALAETFHEAIEDTAYYRSYERSDEPIPRAVLEELAERVCLCRLPHRIEEREAVRALMFKPAGTHDAESCEARRRAFALFLSLLDDNPAVAVFDGEMWRGVIARFLRAPEDDSVAGRTVAAWAALAMKECAQDGLCSIWTEFCHTGFKSQPLDGMRREEVRMMTDRMADGADLELGVTRLEIDPAEPARETQARAIAAASKLDWEDLRDWTDEQDSAISGLVALLVFADRMPDPERVHSNWREIAMQHSEHQDGLLGILTLIRGRLSGDPSMAELMAWIAQRFLIGPHEAIAYSKLPEATFRFYWEETGRFRFFSPGTGGHGRFEPSDDRRGTMASLSLDIGFWDPGEDDIPRLTDDGRAFMNEVLG